MSDGSIIEDHCNLGFVKESAAITKGSSALTRQVHLLPPTARYLITCMHKT
jgi:hypothetical protein